MPSKQAGPIADHFICTDCEWSKAGTHVGNCPECHAAVINGVRTWGQLARLLLAREQRVIGPAEAAILDEALKFCAAMERVGGDFNAVRDDWEDLDGAVAELLLQREQGGG